MGLAHAGLSRSFWGALEEGDMSDLHSTKVWSCEYSMAGLEGDLVSCKQVRKSLVVLEHGSGWDLEWPRPQSTCCLRWGTSQQCWLLAILKDWLGCSFIDLAKSRLADQPFHFAEPLKLQFVFQGFLFFFLTPLIGEREENLLWYSFAKSFVAVNHAYQDKLYKKVVWWEHCFYGKSVFNKKPASWEEAGSLLLCPWGPWGMKPCRYAGSETSSSQASSSPLLAEPFFFCLFS